MSLMGGLLEDGLELGYLVPSSPEDEGPTSFGSSASSSPPTHLSDNDDGSMDFDTSFPG